MNKSGLCFDCALIGRDNHKKDFVKMMKNGEIKTLYCNHKKQIKEYFLEKQNHKCCICGNKDIWNNKNIVFILDHIDGNTNNNKEENLRLVCPNCDSQLDTYKSKNKGGSRKYDKEYRLNYYHKNKPSALDR